MRSSGVSVNESLLSESLLKIVRSFAGVSGYVRANSGDASVSAAITLAAATDGLLVAADDATAQALEGAGVKMTHDLRGKTVSDVLAMGGVEDALSRQIIVFQARSRAYMSTSQYASCA
jgi:hypothetical protein